MESLWCLCDHETDTESISNDNVLFYINYLHKFQILYTSCSTCCQCWSWEAAHGWNHFLFLTHGGNILLSGCWWLISVVTWAIKQEIQTARLYLSIPLSSYYIKSKHIYKTLRELVSGHTWIMCGVFLGRWMISAWSRRFLKIITCISKTVYFTSYFNGVIILF